MNDNREEAFSESKRFLDQYYSADFTVEDIDRWTAYGAPATCAEKIREFADAGVQTMIIRFTSYSQMAQLQRFIEEVVPLL